VLVPYEVWIDLTDPAPQDSPDIAREQRPDAILELIEAGWESGSGFEAKDASDPAAEPRPKMSEICSTYGC
jgi:hypothetical protein